MNELNPSNGVNYEKNRKRDVWGDLAYNNPIGHDRGVRDS